MSNGLNRVTLVGNLGQDPEYKAVGDGGVLKLRIATSESWMKDGQKKEATEWHTVVLWGPRAAALSRFLKKGETVWVEGKLKTRSWEQDGVKRSATEIVASDIGMTGGGKGSQDSGHQPRPKPSYQQASVPDEMDDMGEIPF